MAKRASNVYTVLKPGETQEKLLKRFFKKVKKSEIIKEHLEKISSFKTKREKQREKMLRNKFLKKKNQQKNNKKNK